MGGDVPIWQRRVLTEKELAILSFGSSKNKQLRVSLVTDLSRSVTGRLSTMFCSHYVDSPSCAVPAL